MEQLDHLVEILIQIEFVEHIYGLGHDQKRVGMWWKPQGFENDRASDTEVVHTRAWKHARRRMWKSRSRGRTWSCAPARSRTLSVLNLRPSERYASAALSSIPISLRRNASRLPSLENAHISQHERSVTCRGHLSMSQRVAFVCSLGQQMLSVIQEGHTLPGMLPRLRLYIFESSLRER